MTEQAQTTVIEIRQEQPKEYKQCYKCKAVLPVTQFYRNRTRKDGLADDCKHCNNKGRAIRYRNNNSKGMSYGDKNIINSFNI